MQINLTLPQVIQIILLLSTLRVFAEFTDHFNEFLRSTYGNVTQELLERVDLGLGLWGSFGGKLTENDAITRTPVIFIHGMMNRALSFHNHRDFFMRRGYSVAELYASSYGDGTLSTMMDDALECLYVVQTRKMIVAVHEYTSSKVDIIAYSMGSTVARKAILGGTCLDTNETIGGPLTERVRTYISVAGANYGLQECPKIFNLCSTISSLDCMSPLMKELNSQAERYEGANSFDLHSENDLIIGLKCCGTSCGTLRNANASFETHNHDHFTLLAQTMHLQYALLNFYDDSPVFPEDKKVMDVGADKQSFMIDNSAGHI